MAVNIRKSFYFGAHLAFIGTTMGLSPMTYGNDLPTSLLNMGNGHYYSQYALVVNKKSRSLTVWENQNGEPVKLKEYPSDFGKNPGTKQTWGDKRTPEGIYFFEKMLEGKALDYKQYGSRAFTTNYPNLFDQRDGKLGDGIWLHAIPETLTLERGSKGCVVVRDQVIKEISTYIKLGQTPIIIHDDVNQASAETVHQRFQSISDFVDKWRKTWEGKNLDDYMSYYSDSFLSLGMSKGKWRDYKSGLADKYDTISIKTSQPVAYEFRNYVVVRVLQLYKSSLHEDFGEKTLFIRNEEGNLKIIAESWQSVSDPTAIKEVIEAAAMASASNHASGTQN